MHSFSYDDNQRSIAYITAGPEDGSLLMLVHGWPDIALQWTNQITHFADLGYRVVAPDLPGRGESSANHVQSDYSMQMITNGLTKLIAHLNHTKAIWIGHDWGSSVVSTICATSPEIVLGAVNICIPYHSLELGLEELMKSVNREIYPADQYPWAQWSYQKHYENAFDDITAFYDSEAEGWLKLCHRPGDADLMWKPAHTARTAEDGGPMGGRAKTPKPLSPDEIPTSLISGDKLAAYTAAYKKTGFSGTNALYMNHKENREYVLNNRVNDGKLEFPVLLVEAQYDTVCAISMSTIAEPQRRLCSDLTEVKIESGHWVLLEKPEELNNAIEAWLKKNFSGKQRQNLH